MSTAPNVYFIDDSATMREVIKIAFRRENINVLAFPNGMSAIEQMEQIPPDVVITDVIMPDKDGYEVCQAVKRHPTFGRVPVVLMSGVVNRAVAEKAFAVKADELIRKPFQPQDLIARVRHLLSPKAPVPREAATAAAVSASAALSSIFQAPAGGTMPTARPLAPAPPVPAARPVGQPFVVPNAPAPAAPSFAPPVARATPTSAPPPSAEPPVATPTPAAAAKTPTPQRSAVSGSNDVQKLRIEVLRLEGLVRKLQSELQAEREYARALEEHVKTLQEAD